MLTKLEAKIRRSQHVMLTNPIKCSQNRQITQRSPKYVGNLPYSPLNPSLLLYRQFNPILFAFIRLSTSTPSSTAKAASHHLPSSRPTSQPVQSVTY